MTRFTRLLWSASATEVKSMNMYGKALREYVLENLDYSADYMFERSTNLDRYKGPTLLEAHDQIEKPIMVFSPTALATEVGTCMMKLGIVDTFDFKNDLSKDAANFTSQVIFINHLSHMSVKFSEIKGLFSWRSGKELKLKAKFVKIILKRIARDYSDMGSSARGLSSLHAHPLGKSFGGDATYSCMAFSQGHLAEKDLKKDISGWTHCFRSLAYWRGV